jgi:mono/diheme cytochrome c family protein
MSKSVRIDPSLRAFGFQFPVISCGATYAGKMVLGEVDVEQDGSAYFRVPACVPIYFMVLDEKGRALQRMRSFTHLMPGETQGCIGCHEHRRQAPLAERKLAYGRLPKELEKPEWGIVGFDYSRIVQPILDKHCAECHNPVDPPGGIDLTGGKTDFFNVSYDVLARDNQGRKGSPYVNWIPTYNGHEQNILEVSPLTWGSPQSKLAEVILSGHPDSSNQPRIQLDEKSQRRILAWIDLNVPYYGTSETAYPENTGCRRICPENLDNVLAEVSRRRCSQCHQDGKIPRREWIRITEPELNNFLLAPLAKSAGGNEKCGKVVFADTSDQDYQAVLATFKPVIKMLKQTPRMDMPDGRPAPDLCRVCQ